jgi:hypothetical protein
MNGGTAVFEGYVYNGERGWPLNCSILGNRVLCLYARYRFLDAEVRVRGNSVDEP